MYVTKEAIERVRRSADLVAVIEGRGVKLTRKGKNYVGLCPFHEDHAPSLVVNPSRQLWNCFGACRGNGEKSGGDVFAFVAKADKVSFLEAMKRLGYEEPAPPTVKEKDSHAALARAVPASRSASSPVPSAPSIASLPHHRELIQKVVTHYHRVFRESAAGQEYLKRRGLTDPEMLSAFEVGYVDGSLLKTLDVGGEAAGVLTETGILTARGRELLLGCVVFPLKLPEAGVVGLYGRHVRRDQHLYLL
jgi:DNA primase catalytic core